MRQRYNSFGSYVKAAFGTSVQKVNIDAGFTCPNRDGTVGTDGCIYCNNRSFKPGACRPALSITEQIEGGISYLKRRYGAEKFIAYFQAYTNTYAPAEELERAYNEALSEPSVVGLAIGTRPDCVDREKIALLECLARRCFVLVEYGLQSVHDHTLKYINRGHDLSAFLRAVEMTRDRGIHIGAHTIVGFPTETREQMLETASRVSEMDIGFLKIHQLQVVKDTPLAEIYRAAPFHVFGYEEYLDFVVEFIERLSPRLVLQRLFAAAPDDILIAPKWDKTRHEIMMDINRKLNEKDTFQGKRFRAYARIA